MKTKILFFNKKEIHKKTNHIGITSMTIFQTIRSIGSLAMIVIIVFAFKSSILDANNIPSGSMIPTLKIGDFLFVNKMRYSLRAPYTERELIRIDEPKRGDIVTFTPPEGAVMDENEIADKHAQNRSFFGQLFYDFMQATDLPLTNMFGKKFVKRVVGLPGDTLRVNQKTFKNKFGREVNYSYVEYKEKGETKFKDYSPTLVDEGKELTDMDNLNAIGKSLFQETKRDFKHYVLEGEYVGIYHFIENFCSRQSGECKIPEGYYMVMGDNRDDSSDSRFWGLVKRDDILGKAFGIYFSINWRDNTCMFKDYVEGQSAEDFKRKNRLTDEEMLQTCHPNEIAGYQYETLLGWLERTLRFRIWRLSVRWERIGRLLE